MRPLQYLFRVVDVSCSNPDEERRKWWPFVAVSVTAAGVLFWPESP
jgi:hypothetical protein